MSVPSGDRGLSRGIKTGRTGIGDRVVLINWRRVIECAFCPGPRRHDQFPWAALPIPST